MQRNTIIGFAVALPLLMNTGCAVTMPLDATMRIDTQGWSYSQRDLSINRADMVDKLEQEPENRERIKSARALFTLGIALSALGGVAIGWPLGQYITGERHPHWWIAGAGAGMFLLGGLPLALASDSQVAKAVAVHNKLIDEREAQKKKETQREATTSVRQKSLPPLPEGFGFEFEKGPVEAGALCRALGYQWTDKDDTFSCSSVPTSEIENASAELAFADGHVVNLRISIHPRDNAGSWANAIAKANSMLARMYGEPTERGFVIPSDCIGKAFLGCLASNKVQVHSSWSKNPARSVSLNVVNTPSQPMIVIDIKRLPVAP